MYFYTWQQNVIGSDVRSYLLISYTKQMSTRRIVKLPILEYICVCTEMLIFVYVNLFVYLLLSLYVCEERYVKIW